MKRVQLVMFVGAPGRARRRDGARPSRRRPRSVVVRVPADARLRAPARAQRRRRPVAAEPRLRSVGGEPVAEEAEPLAAQGRRPRHDRPLDAHVDTNTVFFEGFRKATFRYVVTGAAPLEVAVELVRARRRRRDPALDAGRRCRPGAEQQIDWDGTAGGAVVPEGRYEFRVFAAAAAAAAQGGEPPLVADSFRFLDHKFPVRGKHDYGEEIGALRRRPLRPLAPGPRRLRRAAARRSSPRAAAVVRWKAFQSRAGNYVVIDGDGTDDDYAYMHLQAPALVEKGDRVVDRPAHRRRRRHRRRLRLPPALRALDRARAGTRAASRSTRCRTCRPGTRSPVASLGARRFALVRRSAAAVGSR